MPYEEESKKSFEMLDMFFSNHNSSSRCKFINDERESRMFNLKEKRFSKDIVSEKKCENYEEEWIKKAKFVTGASKVNHSHSCSESGCHKRNRIRKLEKNIYQCETSGKVHYCAPDGVGCQEVLLTHQGTYVCLFSSADIGVCYVNEDFHKEEDENSILDMVSDFKRPSGNRKKTANTFDFEKLPKNYGKPAAKLSKKQVPQKYRGKRTETEVEFEVAKQTKLAVAALIFDSKKRASINEKKHERAVTVFKTNAKKYIKTQKHAKMPIKLWDLHEMYIEEVARKEYLCRIEDIQENREWASYYQGLVSVVWRIASQSPYGMSQEKVYSVKKFVLGALYLFKEDYVCGEKNVNWIYHALPSDSDLDLFGRATRDVTDGINFIKKALNSYTKKTEPLALLEIYREDTKLPIKDVPFASFFEK